MSENLNSMEWREFKVSDLFEVFTGGDLILSNIEKGIYPIISHSITNNGIASWTQKIQGRKLFNYKNTISLADRGNFFATIQNHNFYIGTRVKALESKNKIAHLALLFIALCINKQNIRFSYGKNCCGNTESMRIMLPIDSQGQPNYDFMEKFMRQIEKNQIKNQLKTIKSKLTQSTQCTFDINTIKWKEFKIRDLFDKIEKGKCKNTSEETKQSLNGVSFLSATLNNNGVSSFVEPNSLLQKGNCIMFVNQGDGGAGYSVYKKEDFISTTSNSFGYAKWINRYTGLFVASILCRFKEKYGFGYGRNDERLKNDRIMLPIDSNGNPHYAFMESTMQNIEQKHLRGVFDYYTSKLKL